MKTLAFDTTGPTITVGLAARGASVACLNAQSHRGKGNLLEGLITRALSAAHWSRRDIEAIGLITGPGSLTATRIGWAAATGWAQAAGIPITGWTQWEVQHRLWINKPSSEFRPLCVIHYRGDTFLMLDLSCFESGAKPSPIDINEWRSEVETPIILTGPGILGRRDRWQSRIRPNDRIAGDNEAFVRGDILAIWAEDAVGRGEVLTFESAPLDYGLPPDFKKLDVV